MDTYTSNAARGAFFEGPMKNTAPPLEKLHEVPTPDLHALVSMAAADRDGGTYRTPTHSPITVGRDQPPCRSVSVKGDPLEDGSESTLTSLQASPQTQSIASSTGRGGTSQDFVEVIVRLKPTSTRVPDADIKYKITDLGVTAGAHPTSSSGADAGTGPSPQHSTSKEKAHSITPRTSRTRFKDTSGQILEVWPPASATAVTSNPSIGDASARSSTASPGTALEGGADSATRTYRFRHVLAPTVADEEMCATIVPEVLAQLRSQFSVCLLCYGQTGSGKTHTVNALTPAVIQTVFNDFINPETDTVELSYIQIYNDRPYNLLTGARRSGVAASSATGGALSARQPHSAQSLGVPLRRPYGRDVGEPKREVSNAAQALRLINNAQNLRCTTSHTLNARSSRSHTLMTLHITRYADGLHPSTIKVTLGDLAGSERLKRSGATGETKDEAIAINGSLSALQSLVQAKAERWPVLPVRQTVLNRYLASRVLDWHLMFIVTASLEKENYAETKSSLDFANISKDCPVTKRRARPHGFHSPRHSNVPSPTLDVDKERVRELEMEIASLRELLSATDPDASARPQAAERDAAAMRGALPPDASSSLSGDLNNRSALRETMSHYAELLCDREEELRQLSEWDTSDQEQNDALREHVQKRIESLRGVYRRQSTSADALASSPRTAIITSVEAEIALRYLENYFLQAMELTDRALERCRIEEKGREVVLAEKRREEAHRAALSAEHEALRAAHEASITRCAELESVVEGLQLQVLQEKLERVVGEEASQILNATVTKEVEEISVYRRQLEDLRSVEQQQVDAIAMLNQELISTQAELKSVRDDRNDREDTFQLLWSLLTPQQKTRFHHGRSGAGVATTDSDYESPTSYATPLSVTPTTAGTTPVSLAQGHEVIQLRSQVAALRAQLMDKEKALRMSEDKSKSLALRNEAQGKELEDAKERCHALKHDEDRQAMEIFRLERETLDLAAVLTCLRAELARTREALQSRVKEIRHLEKMQHVAQSFVPSQQQDPPGLYANTHAPLHGGAEMGATPASGSATLTAASPATASDALTRAATVGPHASNPQLLGLSRSSPAAPVVPAVAQHHTFGAKTGVATRGNTPSTHVALSAIPGTQSATTHGHRQPPAPAATTGHASKEARDTRLMQERERLLLSSSGSAGSVGLAGPSSAVGTSAKSAHRVRSAGRPRGQMSGAHTVPVRQSAPPRVFAGTRSRSSSGLIGSVRPASSGQTHSRDSVIAPDTRPVQTGAVAASKGPSRRHPPVGAHRTSQAVPDSVVIRRPLSVPRSSITRRRTIPKST